LLFDFVEPAKSDIKVIAAEFDESNNGQGKFVNEFGTSFWIEYDKNNMANNFFKTVNFNAANSSLTIRDDTRNITLLITQSQVFFKFDTQSDFSLIYFGKWSIAPNGN